MLSTLSRALCLALVLVACDKGPKVSAKQEPNVAAAPATPTTTATEPAAVAAPKAAASTDVPGTKYGAGVTLGEAVSVDAIMKDPAAYKGKTVRVEGMIVDVCPKRGCWFELAGSEPGQKLRFKVTDGEMVFPLDAKGMYAVAQGEVSVKELTLEETKQYAEYQAKEYGKPFDPASITSPQAIVRVDGTGAVIRDKK